MQYPLSTGIVVGYPQLLQTGQAGLVTVIMAPPIPWSVGLPGGVIIVPAGVLADVTV